MAVNRFVEVMDQVITSLSTLSCRVVLLLWNSARLGCEAMHSEKVQNITVDGSMASLVVLQAECVVLTECKGLEHHVAGRCELWSASEISQLVSLSFLAIAIACRVLTGST